MNKIINIKLNKSTKEELTLELHIRWNAIKGEQMGHIDQIVREN